MTPFVPTVAEVRAATAAARRHGLTVGLVPTMGALHAGHAALIRAARERHGAKFVVVSIFVNPTQFGPHEDFAKYPRTLDADRQVCADAGADLIWAPTAADMYPPGFSTFVEVTGLQDILEGASRPGHFRGVCTVVAKLLLAVGPDLAVFGAKDYQQAAIVRRMVRDLNIPADIRVEPTVREPDGLARSSRNRYLSAEQRAAAPGIYRALVAVRDRAASGERAIGVFESRLLADLAAIPGARVDYARVMDADTLGPLTTLDRPAAALAAVYLGSTRLIDNLVLAPNDQ
ncbi:MAG: pantoate--beta-alanine ligase [Gemmataceae bacterium]|nr:pantoate--beta-alanine ligase [Gemmataceae bacterium]